MQRRGYILVETLVAMGVLSVGMVAVGNALHQAHMMRAIAKDRTDARFLLEQVTGTVELRTVIEPTAEAGVFPDHPRYQYSYAIDLIQMEMPKPAPSLSPTLTRRLRVVPPLIPRLRVSVKWQRMGGAYEEVFETLLPPERIHPDILRAHAAKYGVERASIPAGGAHAD